MGGQQGYQGTFQNNSFDAYIPPPPNNYGGDFMAEGGPLFPGGSNGGYAKRKAKKRPPTTEGPQNVLPSFDMHFFSMPGAVNSPILPDDFHTTYLPPTTLYSCKTPLYSKAGSEGGFMPPSVAPQGNALTNFNLSTIFPEINKGPGHDGFGDTRAKGFQGPFI
ncbi:hypothetical protein HUJ04_000258 [Dendroctonus ponderosae]|nr:hypothetical protein HUJ04_000258 [Dendroctonus ponderosae]